MELIINENAMRISWNYLKENFYSNGKFSSLLKVTFQFFLDTSSFIEKQACRYIHWQNDILYVLFYENLQFSVNNDLKNSYRNSNEKPFIHQDSLRYFIKYLRIEHFLIRYYEFFL